MRRLWVLAVLAVSTAHAEPAPHDFIDEARQLTAALEQHKQVIAAQDDYRSRWISPARTFFAEHVPSTVPRTVVYPFGGGDLASALVVYPDADSITTLSLEPAGDPRTIAELSPSQLRTALDNTADDLAALYKSSFSRTQRMQDASSGKLPSQLAFALAALALLDYEPVAVRYFELSAAGDLRYLTDADVAAVTGGTSKRHRALANVEIAFRKHGTTRVQIYRHIMANLDDKHLVTSPSALAYLTRLGTVAGIVKAASFLLAFDEFATMRGYLIDHVSWMVSDASGLAPKWGKPAGFTYETYGRFARSEMDAGAPISPSWVAEFKTQPHRELAFRFGYPDVEYHHNLIIAHR